MKLFITSLLSGAILLGPAASSQTAQTRSTLYAVNNGNIFSNTVGAVTPQNVNSVIASVIASAANLVDANAFTVSPKFPLTGFLYGNGATNPLTAIVGFSGTKTAGSCTFAITNGLIVSVTGC